MRKLTDVQLESKLNKLTAESEKRKESKRIAAEKEMKAKREKEQAEHRAKCVGFAARVINHVGEATSLGIDVGSADGWALMFHLTSTRAILERMYKEHLCAK